MANQIRPPDVQANLWRRTANNSFENILEIYQNEVDATRTRRRNHYLRRVKPQQKAPLSRFDNGSQHPNYPGLSEDITFTVSANRSRCANASREIAPCRTIAAIEAFASAVDKTDEPYCLTCHEVQWKFDRCANCTSAFFCQNGRCQVNNQTHTYECGSQFHNIAFNDDIIVKCGIQMVLKCLAIFDVQVSDDANPQNNAEIDANNADNLNTLQEFVENILIVDPNGTVGFSHRVPRRTISGQAKLRCIMRLYGIVDPDQERRNYDLERQTMQAFDIIMKKLRKVAYIFRRRRRRNLLQNLLMHFLKILRANSFDSVILQTRKVRTCSIFDALSLFNHSCSPNLIHIFDGTKAYLISTRRIPEGAELCIDYNRFGTEKTRERREILKKNWNFDCFCVRCVEVDTYGPDHEITQAELIDVSSTAQNAADRFRTMENKINREFPEGVDNEWYVKDGALTIAYRTAIVDNL